MLTCAQPITPQAKKELRSERGTRRVKETDAFLLRREHGVLLEQRNALDQQIHEIEDIWAHQRSYLVHQVCALAPSLCP